MEKLKLETTLKLINDAMGKLATSGITDEQYKDINTGLIESKIKLQELLA